MQFISIKIKNIVVNCILWKYFAFFSFLLLHQNDNFHITMLQLHLLHCQSSYLHHNMNGIEQQLLKETKNKKKWIKKLCWNAIVGHYMQFIVIKYAVSAYAEVECSNGGRINECQRLMTCWTSVSVCEHAFWAFVGCWWGWAGLAGRGRQTKRKWHDEFNETTENKI